MSESRNHSIDLLKFILAYQVVMLHCSQEPTSIFRSIVDGAVPCFFMISGFFIYDIDESRYEMKLKKATQRIFYILCWSTLLCSINDFYRLFFHHEIGSFTWESIWTFLFFNENPFAFHLWYIAAYLYVLIIYLLILKVGLRVKTNLVVIIWLTGIGIAIWSSLTMRKSIDYYYIRNFMFQGIPFFGIGLLLSQKKRAIEKIQIWYIVLAYIIVVCLAIIEKSQEKYNIGTYVFSGIIALVTLVLFIKIKMHKPNYLTMIGKEDGLYIYIFHPFVMNLLKTKSVLAILGYNGYLFSTIVFVLTIVGIRVYHSTTKQLKPILNKV